MVVYDKYFVKNKQNKTKTKNKKKIDQQKSIYADYESKKSTFLKRVKSKK